MKQKLNMTIGRFQPFTQGHLNMVNEGEGPCIVYRINSSNKEIERKYDRKKVFTGIKIGSKSFTKDSVSKVIDFINKPDGELSETEKELLKRPFTNDLIEKELNIVKKNTPNIIDIIYVTNAYEAFALFNKFILDNQDKYEPQYWMCGDDRVEDYTNIIEKDDEIAITRGGEKFQNICKGKLKVNIGKGRTEGVSGTEVRKSILNNDKIAFERIMPKGVGVMFKDFVDAFNEFKSNLQEYIKESQSTLSLYINNHIVSLSESLRIGLNDKPEEGYITGDRFRKTGAAGGEQWYAKSNVEIYELNKETLENIWQMLYPKYNSKKEISDIKLKYNKFVGKKSMIAFAYSDGSDNKPTGDKAIYIDIFEKDQIKRICLIHSESKINKNLYNTADNTYAYTQYLTKWDEPMGCLGIVYREYYYVDPEDIEYLEDQFD